MNKKLIAALAAVGMITTISGCGSDSSSTSAAPKYTRVAPLAAQTATISIADPTGTPVVTITQASDIALAATATTDGTTVSLDLDMTNNGGRLLFGGKVVVTNIVDSTATNAVAATATGTIGGDTYTSFGLKAIEDGATASAADLVVVSDLDGLDDPLVLTVEIPTNHSLAFGKDGTSSTGIEIIDVASDEWMEVETESVSYRGADSTDGAFNAGVSSADGRYIFGGSRNTASVIVMDTVTHELSTIAVPEKGASGHVTEVTISPDGAYLYAAVHVGDHQYRWDAGSAFNANYLVKINATTMKVVKSADISGDSGVPSDRVRDVDLSADGSVAAISTVGAGEVTIVNTGSMSVVKRLKADSSMARHVAISPDATTVYVANMDDNVYSYDGNLQVIDVDSEVSSTLTLTDQSTNDPQCLDFGPDGRLYYCRSGAMTIVEDPTAATLVEVSVGSNVRAVAFDAEGDYYYALDGSDPDQYDIATDTVINQPSNASMGQQNLIISAY